MTLLTFLTVTRRFPATGWHILTLVLLSAGAFGCGQAPAPATPKTGSTSGGATQTAGKSTAAPAAGEEDQCANLMQSIAGTFKLERLGISADLKDGLSLLNQWQRICKKGDGDKFTLPADVLESYKRVLPAAQLELLERRLYRLRDGEHLRNCLLFKAVQQHALGKAASDLGRVLNLFYHVVRNIDLLEAHPDEIPLSLYEVYLLGHGTAEDRAWLFVNLLRQLKIDAVLLFPAGTTSLDEESLPFLVGVLLDAQVYLFDPRAGLPIPAPDGDPSADKLNPPGTAGTVMRVATLTQVLAQPELLKSLDISAEQPYPITAEALQKPLVAVVGNTSLWSPRMEQLQPEFTGARVMLIHDGLFDNAERKGLISRVANFGSHGWDAKTVRAWPYPERQLSGFESLNAKHNQTLTRLTDAWNAPVTVKEVTVRNKAGAVEKRLALDYVRNQLRARMAQVEGRYEDAIKGFTTIQIARSSLPPQLASDPRLKLMHEQAGKDAAFFIGICKLEQGKPSDLRIAADKFRQYLTQFKDGNWDTAAHYLLAITLANGGDVKQAIEQLQAIPADHPQRFGFHYLIHRWERTNAGNAKPE